MKFARVVFLVAGIYGLIVLLPQYFLEAKVGLDSPPPITHPEFYYGFVGLALSWQLVFVLIARDPMRYRPIMPISILEKLVYAVPVLILYSLGKAHPSILGPALIDPLLGLLFVIAYVKTRGPQPKGRPPSL